MPDTRTSLYYWEKRRTVNIVFKGILYLSHWV